MDGVTLDHRGPVTLDMPRRSVGRSVDCLTCYGYYSLAQRPGYAHRSPGVI